METKIDINKINKLLSEGLVPNELFYTKEKKIVLDMDKIDYNINMFEHFCKRFKYYESIPGFDKVIEDMAKNSLSPLEEYKLKKNNFNLNINE